MSASFSRRGPAAPQAGDREDGGSAARRFFAEHRAGLGGLAVAAAAIVVGWGVWSRLAGPVRAQPDRVLFPEAVELVGVAPWVKCDLRAEALRNASLDGGLPLDDPELPRRLARGFDMHPWVRQVIAVDVRHPAAARVEVACREPVAMVTVKGGLLAVDGEGVVLPSADFTPESAAAYPRITGIASSPQAPEGFPWGDPLVEEGAALAAAIGPEWAALGLVECRPVGGRGGRGWELVGPGNGTIRFGSVPGREQPGEPGAAVKIARLRTLAGAAESAHTIDLTAAEPTGQGQPELPSSIPVP